MWRAATRRSATRSAHRGERPTASCRSTMTSGIGSREVATFTPAKSTIDLTVAGTMPRITSRPTAPVRWWTATRFGKIYRTGAGLDASRHLTSRVDLRLVGAALRLDGALSNAPDSPGDSTSFYGNDDSRIERRSADLRTDVLVGAGATVSLGANIEREQVKRAAARVNSGHSRRAPQRSRSTARTRQSTPRRLAPRRQTPRTH